MPVDTNRAGYVRQTGLSSGTRLLPRALLPLPCENGIVDLSNLRDPSHPFDPQAKPGGDEPAIVWIDLHIPADAVAGDYALRCDIAPAGRRISRWRRWRARFMFTILRFRRTGIC